LRVGPGERKLKVNFFNFKRKHWMIIIIFLVVVISAVAGFAYFLEKELQKTRMTIRGLLIPEPFKVSETEASAQTQADIKSDPLSRQIDLASQKATCTSCAERKKEMVSQSLDEFSLQQKATQQSLSPMIDAERPFFSIAGLDNQFVREIFQKISKDTGWKNINVSPAGISFALAMAYEGAKGQTAEEMRSVLGFPLEKDDFKTQAHQEFSSLIPSLNDDQISCVNSSWVGKDFVLLPEYKEAVKMVYRSEAHNVDFCNSLETAGKINIWCAEKTKGRIKEILGETSCDLRLVLINAIYFKAKWQTPFPKEQTTKKSFFIDDNSQVDVDMMIKQDEYSYTETPSFQILEMPYEKNRFSMIIFLPKEKKSKVVLEQLSSDVNGQGLWQEAIGALSALRKIEINVHFPKFEFYNTWNSVKEYLQSLGMTSPFGPFANFSGISTEPLYIDKIIQKTFIKVDEESTEAAAVTMVGMRFAAEMPTEPLKEFMADHPFIYVIKDNQTQSILFIGQVVDPTKS
jgi:serpin B